MPSLEITTSRPFHWHASSLTLLIDILAVGQSSWPELFILFYFMLLYWIAGIGIVFHCKHNSKIHSYIQSLNPILKILNLNTSKTPQSLFKPKGGNFIYPMMHRFILYYQAAERMWCYQFNRDVTIEQQCKATCFADKTFCTFAVSIYLWFSFYYSKYISC